MTFTGILSSSHGSDLHIRYTPPKTSVTILNSVMFDNFNQLDHFCQKFWLDASVRDPLCLELYAKGQSMRRFEVGGT